MQKPPPYALKSVDNALRAAVLLQQEGPQRVTDVADRLDVSASTAYRLLAMLVHREFAIQDTDRRYRPGPVLGEAVRVDAPVDALRHIARPHMQRLVDETDETCQLIVAAGTDARFLLTVECTQVLRVTDRAGRSKPLHLTSGGRALLAEMNRGEVERLYRAHPDVDQEALLSDLAHVRDNGFAVNDQQTEEGLTALGVTVRGPAGLPCAALALAMPTPRFRAAGVRAQVTGLKSAASRIEDDLKAEDGVVP